MGGLGGIMGMISKMGGKSGGGGGNAGMAKKLAPKKSAQESSGGDGATASPSSYHHGGKVRRTGKAKVRKGERILTAKQDRKYRKISKRKSAARKRYAK